MAWAEIGNSLNVHFRDYLGTVFAKAGWGKAIEKCFNLKTPNFV